MIWSLLAAPKNMRATIRKNTQSIQERSQNRTSKVKNCLNMGLDPGNAAEEYVFQVRAHRRETIPGIFGRINV